MAMVSRPFNLIRTYVASLAWVPLVNLSRSFVLPLLKRIEIGTVVVIDNDGAVFVCGAHQPDDSGPNTELRVLKESFWVRILLFADMVRQNSVSMAHEAKLVACAYAPNWRKLRAVRNLGLCGKFHVG